MVAVSSPLAQLPDVVLALVGELADGWIDEPRADCGNCPPSALGAQGVPYPFSMNGEARCCTAQPALANFLVGRVTDAAVVRARIANRDGVSAWGIGPTAGYDDTFMARAATGFGRDVGMRCPFWVGGDRACGVWAGRSARCRAFFCRHDLGLASAMARSQIAGLGATLEHCVADHLVETLGGVADDASDDALLAWYTRCADAAEHLDAAAAAAIVRRVPPRADASDTSDPSQRIPSSPKGRLITRLRVHRPAMPERLVPCVSEIARVGDDVWLAGYSTFDAVRAPASVFELFARLDGTTPWRDVLAALRPAHPELDEALVRELRRAGALRDPAGSDDPPESPTG
jgi:hypothetical protein